MDNVVKEYCPRCDKEFEGDWEKHDCYVPLVKAMDAISKRYQEVCVGKHEVVHAAQDAAMRSVYYKQTWNEAIEAAASRFVGMKEISEKIRKLKK